MNNNIHTQDYNIYQVHHAPLIVDINTQRSYRRWGHVSWPTRDIVVMDTIYEQEKLKSIVGGEGYASWPTER